MNNLSIEKVASGYIMASGYSNDTMKVFLAWDEVVAELKDYKFEKED